MVVVFQIPYSGQDECKEWMGKYGRTYKNACFRHAVLEAVTRARTVRVIISLEGVPDHCDYCGEESRSSG